MDSGVIGKPSIDEIVDTDRFLKFYKKQAQNLYIFFVELKMSKNFFDPQFFSHHCRAKKAGNSHHIRINFPSKIKSAVN